MIIINEPLTPRMQILSAVGATIFLLLIINLIRKEYIRPGYAIVWCVTGTILFIFSIFTSLLFKFSLLIGIEYPPAALFLVLLGGLLLVSIHFSIIISKHEKHIKDLSQEIALLKFRLTKILKKKIKSISRK